MRNSPTCKNQQELKNDIAAIKNKMEGFNTRPEEGEDHISKLEDKVDKKTQADQELKQRNKQNKHT